MPSIGYRQTAISHCIFFKGIVLLTSMKLRVVPKILLIIFFIFVFAKYVTDKNYSFFIDNFNLLIHEGGHMFFMFFGNFLAVLGGTLFQLLIPVLVAFNFYKQKDFFALSFSLFWLGTNLFGIARYVADAPVQLLPLVHVGYGDPIHDWNYILTNLHVLNQANTFATLTFSLAYSMVFISIIYGSFIVYKAIFKK